MSNKSKSDKWNKAAARANGEETALVKGGAPTDVSQIGSAEVLAMIETADAAEIQAEIASGAIDAAPRIMELQEGMRITGHLYASGMTKLPNMQNPAVLDDVSTYQIELYNRTTGERGPRISIIGSAQLDRDLPPRMGKNVTIAVGGKTDTKRGRQVREFFVGTHVRPGTPVDAK